MKKFVLILSLLLALPSWARSPKLDSAVKMVESCLVNEKVLLCNEAISSELKSVNMDARGDFVYVLKDFLNQNETPKVIANLYEKLQPLVGLYATMDTASDWSLRDLKMLLGDVSIRFVKVSAIDSAFLIDLYKKQAVESGRYGLLQTVLDRGDKATTLKEMDELVTFGEFAKNYSRTVGDEYYLYQSAVEIVRKMTLKALKIRPGHEGIYAVTFDQAGAANGLNIDRVVVMESNDRDALVVSFISSESRIIKFAFKGSGVLGNRFFSNEAVYNDTPDMALPFFTFDLDRATGAIKGVFSTASLGALNFKGQMMSSNISVYNQKNIPGLSLDQLLGTYKVKVGSYEMKLVLLKRLGSEVVEAALYNDNAVISFSKVALDSAKGILSIVDTKNERKLTLGILAVDGGILLRGTFLNSPQANVLDVHSN